jgi:hypothetical protein
MLKLIKPDIVDTNRDLCSNWISCIPFFQKYNYMKNNRKYKPAFIFNMDEVSLNSQNTQKHFHVALSDEVINYIPSNISLSKSTCLLSVSADGTFLPLVVLIPQKKLPKEFSENNDENIHFISSPNG